MSITCPFVNAIENSSRPSAIKKMLFTLIYFPSFENYRNRGHFEKDHPKNGKIRGNLIVSNVEKTQHQSIRFDFEILGTDTLDDT